MLCGIDLGTSSLKCAFFDDSGRSLGLGVAPVGLYHGEERGEFCADPLEWARAAAEAIGQALVASGRSASDIEAVSVSGNGPTLVAVGADDRPIGGALSWMDRRATDQAARAEAVAGRPVDPSFYLPKAMKVLEERPEGEVRRFFSAPEYLAFLMGAEPVSYLVDPYFETYVWDLETAGKLGLSASLFPRYVGPCVIIGTVSARASAVFGLPAGAPISSSYPDFLAALIGSGTVRPGMACDRSGSSEALNLCASAPFPDIRLFSLPHAQPGLWNLSGGLSTSGKALEWFSRQGGYSGIEADTIYQDFLSATPGARGALFLPYLAGERAPLWNPDLRGAFVGLSLEHGRKELARAVVESLAYGLRLVAEIMAECPTPPELIRCSGGAARNEALCALKADVLGLAVEVPETPECETLGDACAAAIALGRYANIAEAVRAMVRPRNRYEPDVRNAAIHDDTYGRWKEALLAISGLGVAGGASISVSKTI